jgi:hypothetical protein
LNDEIIDCSVDTKNNIAYFSSSSTIYRVNVNGDNWFQNALNVQNDGIIGTIVDAERQSFWQINENTICLKNLYGEEIFCLDIELESMDIDYSSSSSSSIDSSSSSSMIYSSSTSSELYSESSSSELYSESSSSGLYSSSTSSELYSESSSSEIYSSSTSSGLYSESSSSEIYSSSTSSELYSESSSSGMAGSESSSSVDIPYTGPTLWFDAENVTLDGTEITEFIDKVNGFVWQLASVSFIGGTQITNELNGHSVLRKASGSSAYRYASYDDVADMGPFTGTQIVVVKGGGEANRNCIWGGLENDTFEVTNTNWAILSQINVWKVDGALRGSICGHYSGSTTDTYVGDFAELMLYNRILQPNELQDAINYLSNKYNISTVVTASTSSSSSS